MTVQTNNFGTREIYSRLLYGMLSLSPSYLLSTCQREGSLSWPTLIKPDWWSKVVEYLQRSNDLLFTTWFSSCHQSSGFYQRNLVFIHFT